MFTAFRSFTNVAPKRFLFLLALGLSIPFTSAVAQDIKVAFIGDQGIAEEAQRVLELIRDEGTELLLIQGDLGYENDSAGKWIENIDNILGKDFPVLMVVGNHENYEWPKYLEWQKDKLSRVSSIRCEGAVSVKAYCTYKNIGVVQVSPGITEVEGINGSDDYAGFINEKFKDDDSAWRICSWHKNMRDMQAGGKSDATGWGVYQNCLAQGGMVMTGHEHSYSRTHLMSDFQNRKVVHTSDEMDIGPNSSLAFVSGLGGRGIREQKHGGDWFASIYTSSQGASPGSLFCSFNGDRADCYFKDVAGLVPDTFKLKSKLSSSGNTSDEADPEAELAPELEPELASEPEPELEPAQESEPEPVADPDESEGQTPDESEGSEPTDSVASEQTDNEDTGALAQPDPDTADQTPNAESEPQGQSEPEVIAQTSSEESAVQPSSEEPETQTQSESETAEPAPSEELGNQEQSGSETQALDETAEVAGEEILPPSAATELDDELADAENEVQSADNPFGTIPTGIADNVNTPIAESSPPPPLEEASSTGGGALGWLAVTMIGFALTLRRTVSASHVKRRCRTRFYKASLSKQLQG